MFGSGADTATENSYYRDIKKPEPIEEMFQENPDICIGFCYGSMLKYLSRCGKKPGETTKDILKIYDYFHLMIYALKIKNRLVSDFKTEYTQPADINDRKNIYKLNVIISDIDTELKNIPVEWFNRLKTLRQKTIDLKKRLFYSVYISGPMSGFENKNFDEFFKVENQLSNKGLNTINPAKINIEHGLCDRQGADIIPNSIRDFYNNDFNKLINDAEAITMLPGWLNSKGAKAELFVALGLGLDVVDGFGILISVKDLVYSEFKINDLNSDFFIENDSFKNNHLHKKIEAADAIIGFLENKT